MEYVSPWNVFNSRILNKCDWNCKLGTKNVAENLQKEKKHIKLNVREVKNTEPETPSLQDSSGIPYIFSIRSKFLSNLSNVTQICNAKIQQKQIKEKVISFI